MYDAGFVAVPGGLTGLQSAISDAYFPIELERAARDEVQGAIATASMGALRWTSIRVSGPFYTRRRLRAGTTCSCCCWRAGMWRSKTNAAWWWGRET
jgi:hypothetical protein